MVYEIESVLSKNQRFMLLRVHIVENAFQSDSLNATPGKSSPDAFVLMLASDSEQEEVSRYIHLFQVIHLSVPFTLSNLPAPIQVITTHQPFEWLDELNCSS